MVQSYCTYGIYNEDTAQCLEEGDYVERLTYWDNGNKVTLTKLRVSNITKDEITFELEDLEEVIISVEEIEDWD